MKKLFSWLLFFSSLPAFSAAVLEVNGNELSIRTNLIYYGKGATSKNTLVCTNEIRDLWAPLSNEEVFLDEKKVIIE